MECLLWRTRGRTGCPLSTSQVRLLQESVPILVKHPKEAKYTKSFSGCSYPTEISQDMLLWDQAIIWNSPYWTQPAQSNSRMTLTSLKKSSLAEVLAVFGEDGRRGPDGSLGYNQGVGSSLLLVCKTVSQSITRLLTGAPLLSLVHGFRRCYILLVLV